MAKKNIHHMDFQTLVQINKEVVALTGEPHGYTPADGEKIEELLKEVEARADNVDFAEAVPDKASLLVFHIASGQHFKTGNKRTALIAGQVFLRKNGYSINLKDEGLVSVVDRVGVAAATLDDLFTAITKLMKKAPVERKGWDKTVSLVVESNRKLLTDVAA